MGAGVLADIGQTLLDDAQDLQLLGRRELQVAAVVLKQAVRIGLPAEAQG